MVARKLIAAFHFKPVNYSPSLVCKLSNPETVFYCRIPKTVGVSIPMKATFFITYIMVDGWSGIAAEIVRLSPLVVFHLKNTFLVKTEKDREEAMNAGSLTFAESEPRIQLYFLLGLVYSTVTPILLPFIVVFFAFAYVVFRHQVCFLAHLAALIIFKGSRI